MTYKKKVTVILSVIAVLALTFAASLLFDPETAGARSSLYSWLDSKLAARAVKINIKTKSGDVELVKKSNQWFVMKNGAEYPARRLRVEDFIGIFTARSSWPVRSSNASAHERLGVSSDNADRVTIYGDTSAIMDVLLGGGDSTGTEIYMRRYAQNEVRSGSNIAASYLTGSSDNWYNLRLIPETEDGKIGIDSVQRFSVFRGAQTQVFTRRNREWTVSGIEVTNPGKNAIDDYLRTILNTEGDDFSDSVSTDDPMFDNNRIAIEFGNGTQRIIRISDSDEGGRCYAYVMGSEYVYSIPSWAAQRLFLNAGDFEKE